MKWPPFSFQEPWEEFLPRQAAAFVREAQTELSSGHPLHGTKLTALAHSTRADDALFQLEDGRVVEAHLTWSGRPELPPWPRHRVYASLEEWAQQVMIPSSEDR
jgi:hypothetical protein